MYVKVIQTCIYMYPFFLKFFPSKVITEYWIEFSVIYSRSLLDIYFIFDSVYMSYYFLWHWLTFAVISS